eukprot:m.136941 g.136941  ORF g.136941 m.136941 type:complete len:213 (-) comp14741_c0_seq7:50-688(-)
MRDSIVFVVFVLVGLVSKCEGAALLSGAKVAQMKSVIPSGSLTHFCVITGWDNYNTTLESYANMLGQDVPKIGRAGGLDSNGTYLGKRLLGTTKIAFLNLNNMTYMEFLSGDPDYPSWWRDVYNVKGKEIHHMGYHIDEPIWPAVQKFEKAGLGIAKQWARWGEMEHPGSGCYVYMDSQETLGVTTEILANEHDCDSLPKAPPTKLGKQLLI